MCLQFLQHVSAIVCLCVAQLGDHWFAFALDVLCATTSVVVCVHKWNRCAQSEVSWERMLKWFHRQLDTRHFAA
jgi:hypothetical protein